MHRYNLISKRAYFDENFVDGLIDEVDFEDNLESLESTNKQWLEQQPFGLAERTMPSYNFGRQAGFTLRV